MPDDADGGIVIGGGIEGARSRQCIGKQRHLTIEEASAKAKHLHKKYKAKFTGYQCPHCKYFHVGMNRSEIAAVRREIRRGR